ncbi:glycine--tRNA ligase, partial [Candidatus Gracilibacteria bacterium]|nr:glycine--tRNA ligase [Candidatus Gracilibacteria bacterium]
MSATSLDQIVSLCKQRGFIFPGSEIYGGLANTWDYGPIGVELKNNVKQFWWDFWVRKRDDIVGVDASILMNPKVWEASGHVSNFADPLVDCKSCKKRFRGDKLIEEYLFSEFGTSITIQKFHMAVLKKTEENVDEKLKEFVLSVKSAKSTAEVLKETEDLNKFIFSFLNGSKIPCPACKKSDWSEPRNFNLMFRTSQGVTEDSEREIYMRPETAQGIFVNFKNVLNSSRKKLPFGIAQIGKAFRNEITPGNFTFRTREFEQMEVEYFCAEKDWKKIYPELEKASWDFFLKLGIEEKNLRWRQHDDAELSHYSKLTKDIEYKFPWGWGELQGLAYRTDFDLKQHQK